MATATKKLKPGTPVRFIRKNGEKVSGRLAGYETLANGEWALVNLAEPRKTPVIAKVRPGQLVT